MLDNRFNCDIYNPMVYTRSDTERVDVLAFGFYRDRGFFVVNENGNYPCVYVHAPEFEGIPAEEINPSYVHGNGISYSENGVWVSKPHTPKEFMNIKGWFVGWKYTAEEDFIGSMFLLEDKCPEILRNAKKWTTEEVVRDCGKVIDAILEEIAKRSC